MRLDTENIKRICKDRGRTLGSVLDEAGVSRTAFYSLARRESVLPASVRALAGTLGTVPSAILDEAPAIEWRTRVLLRQAQRIVAEEPQVSFENVWHTLVLLEEPPVERLRRSLLRGRAVDLH